MLFKAAALDGIADGSIDLAFRRWDSPRVKPGSRQRTRIGIVEFDAVRVVEPDEITDAEARRAGFESRAAILAALAASRRAKNPIHRIELHLAGPDPRVELRERIPDAAELAELRSQLAAMDARSAQGPWTERILRTLADRPGVRAPDLAASFDRPTPRFKADVRRLKELGLTESLEVGYRLSPRGEALLADLSASPGTPAPRRSATVRRRT